MSALDKAFIKAYHKDASPASAAPRARPAETPASQNASGCETPSAAPAMDSHNDQPGHRVDDAHAEPPAPHRAPHVRPCRVHVGKGRRSPGIATWAT